MRGKGFPLRGASAMSKDVDVNADVDEPVLVGARDEPVIVNVNVDVIVPVIVAVHVHGNDGVHAYVDDRRAVQP